MRANLSALDIGARASVVGADAMSVVGKYGPEADLVFVDPPYSTGGLGAAFIKRLGGVIRSGAIVVWEQDAPDASMPGAEMWEILRDKQYGRARFMILRKK